LRKREPAERVTRRVRAFRKKRREELKKHDTYIWGLKNYLRLHSLKTGWVFAQDVYKFIEVLNLRITYEQFIEAIVGNRKKDIPGVKSIEVSTVVDSGSRKMFLIRPQHVPTPRRRK
jgi:hypothetical protein